MFGDDATVVNSLVDNALDLSTPRGAEFKLTERVRYLLTILRAYENSEGTQTSEITQEQIDVLLSIASHALYHIEPLKRASDKHPTIGDFLNLNENAIQEIQNRFDAPNRV